MAHMIPQRFHSSIEESVGIIKHMRIEQISEVIVEHFCQNHPAKKNLNLLVYLNEMFKSKGVSGGIKQHNVMAVVCVNEIGEEEEIHVTLEHGCRNNHDRGHDQHSCLEEKKNEENPQVG